MSSSGVLCLTPLSTIQTRPAFSHTNMRPPAGPAPPGAKHTPTAWFQSPPTGRSTKPEGSCALASDASAQHNHTTIAHGTERDMAATSSWAPVSNTRHGPGNPTASTRPDCPADRRTLQAGRATAPPLREVIYHDLRVKVGKEPA